MSTPTTLTNTYTHMYRRTSSGRVARSTAWTCTWTASSAPRAWRASSRPSRSRHVVDQCTYYSACMKPLCCKKARDSGSVRSSGLRFSMETGAEGDRLGDGGGGAGEGGHLRAVLDVGGCVLRVYMGKGRKKTLIRRRMNRSNNPNQSRRRMPHEPPNQLTTLEHITTRPTKINTTQQNRPRRLLHLEQRHLLLALLRHGPPVGRHQGRAQAPRRGRVHRTFPFLSYKGMDWCFGAKSDGCVGAFRYLFVVVSQSCNQHHERHPDCASPFLNGSVERPYLLLYPTI